MEERPLILDIIDQWEQEIDEIVESDIPELALDEKISELEEHIDEHLEYKFIIIKDDIYILKPKVDYNEELNDKDRARREKRRNMTKAERRQAKEELKELYKARR